MLNETILSDCRSLSVMTGERWCYVGSGGGAGGGFLLGGREGGEPVGAGEGLE